MIQHVAPETVRRIDARFEIERTINGESAERRKAVRQELSRSARGQSGSLDARNAPSSRAATMSPRTWTTCSSAGAHLHVSSTTAASACQTMRPSVAYAASLWVGNRGCSAARIAAASGDVQRHRHRQDEQRRSASLARLRSRAHRRASSPKARRAAAMELALRHPER